LEPWEFKCKWYNDKNDFWKIADEVRDKYWPEGTLPIDIETIVEFRLNLDIEPKHNLFSEIDMDAYLKRDLSGILVDYDFYMNEKFANRIRFSFAHELGHFFLHKDIYSQLALVSVDDWKNFILNVPENEYRNFEWQANEFVGRLLVPHGELETAMEKVLEIIKDNNLAEFLKKDSDAVLSSVSPALCRPFGVSTDVIGTRVKREGLWPPEL
jgi:hypothetical protein